MLGKEILEDSLLSFLTQELPDIEADGQRTLEKVQQHAHLSLFNKDWPISR